MTIPKVRITLTMAERDLIKPGLDTLRNGLASARLGSFPNRHAYDRIDLASCNIYADRAYDAAMAARCFSLGFEIREMTATRKVRLDLFELATAALALRVSGKLARHRVEPLAAGETKSLANKLENYRKRAKRQLIRKFGEAAFATLGKAWRKYVEWVRYHLTQFTLPTRVGFDSKLLWRQQHESLAAMITQAIQERCYSPLSREQLARMASLTKNALRRGRLPMTLRELLAADRKGRDILFAFVETRVKLEALAGAEIAPGLAYLQRAARFEDWKNRL
jgi:hypothetical protein